MQFRQESYLSLSRHLNDLVRLRKTFVLLSLRDIWDFPLQTYLCHLRYLHFIMCITLLSELIHWMTHCYLLPLHWILQRFTEWMSCACLTRPSIPNPPNMMGFSLFVSHNFTSCHIFINLWNKNNLCFFSKYCFHLLFLTLKDSFDLNNLRGKLFSPTAYNSCLQQAQARGEGS